MALIGDVKQLLSAAFPGAEVHLKRFRPGNRIGGSVVWNGFDGQMQIDRQVRLRDVIDSELPAEQRTQVSFIMTLTPDEEAILAAD